MDSSKRASSTDSKSAIAQDDRAGQDFTDDDFDRSSPLSTGRVLRRALQDESGQDYFVYLPAAGAVDAPVLVVLHDVDRDARAQAVAFAALSEQYGAVLVAPHFSSDRYPNYQRFGRSRVEADHRRSANEALDAILEEVSALCGASTEKVHLFGFGGGGRFSMRYAMLHPERVSGAVIAEPGAYTFPDEGRRFPQGIAPSRKRPDFQPEPSRFLRVPMALLENESELDDPNRTRLEDVDRIDEGPERRVGRAWVEAMQAAAADHQMPSAVSYGQIGSGSLSSEQAHSFAEFAASFGLMESVFEILLGSKKLEQTSEPAESEVDTALARARWARMRRMGVGFLLVCGLVALVVPLAIWGHYRSMHVVARDAVVRGHIADLGAPLDGVVRSVEVDNGDRVVAGQIVVRLEDRQFDAKRRRAESQLEKARRELEVEGLAIINERARLESSLRGGSADLSAAGAEVRVAESRAQEALRRFELQRTMALDGLVAAERVRAAETELRTARAQVSAARAERTSAQAGRDLAETNYDGLAVREKRVSVLESEVSALEAELAVAQANLEGAVIRAPEDGAVVRRIVEPGGSTVVGQPIISLWLGQELWVEAWVDESALGEVAIGSRATITFTSHPNREFGGTVESLAVSTDMELPDSEVPQPRSERMRDAPVVSVRVKLDEAEKDLFPGLSAVVSIRKRDR